MSSRSPPRLIAGISRVRRCCPAKHAMSRTSRAAGCTRTRSGGASPGSGGSIVRAFSSWLPAPAPNRFECHVDSNPLTGLLFLTDHAAGAGGELVFAHDPNADSVIAVERDCTVIRPRAGLLIFFDGRRHPHYARALRSESDVRVVAVMNFYTESYPESTRPRELNRHLYGDR